MHAQSLVLRSQNLRDDTSSGHQLPANIQTGIEQIKQAAYLQLESLRSQMGEPCYARAKQILDDKLSGKTISAEDTAFMEKLSAGDISACQDMTSGGMPVWGWVILGGIAIWVGYQMFS